jgi:ABC-type lipoprotein release transport system permease subunit
MNARRYILQSLAHYRSAYVGVFAGAVLGATVLLGALFAGDSVKTSLRQIGEKRIGRATHAVTAGDRFFREALAADLASNSGARVAPLIYVRGTTTHAGNQLAASQVQLIGVTEAFWQLAPSPTNVPLDAAASRIAVNDTLARRLNVAVGDTLVVRLHKPGILAGNAPVAGADTTLQSLRCTVAAIVDDASFGRFSLEATQVAPASVFLPIELLQQSLEYPGRANLLLIDAANSKVDLAETLAASVQLADYGLSLRWIERASAFEVASNRIFIDPELASAITQAVPDAQPVTSYLVNEFRVRDRSTPYSIATATTHSAAPFLPAEPGPRDIVLTAWLAEDLEATVGDEVRLTFFQAGAAGSLVEQSASFRVSGIVPLEGLAADEGWMPQFPGMSDAESPDDWDPGLPLDLELIRDKDERYWDEYRGAPKAYLSAAAGREIWSTRWGQYTALRVPIARDQEAALTAKLRGALRPEMNQLIVRDFRAAAQTSAQSAVDFGGLFIGMSFFLIVAALGLVAMLFQFVLLQRNREDALLSAVGLPPRKLLRWRLSEGALLLLMAIALGVPLALLYTRAILRFLEQIWAGQGGPSTFVFAASPTSAVVGGASFLVISIGAIWMAARRQTRRTLSIRLASHREETAPNRGTRRASVTIASVAAVVGISAIVLSNRGLPAQVGFYLAGFAFLGAGIALCRAWLTQGQHDGAKSFNAARLGALNLRARRSRSLTVVAAIATAVFMVLSVSSFRKQVGSDWLDRHSGTGGFTYWIETTAPLNAARDGRATGFEAFENVKDELGAIVPLRAGAGDNINCFNLNTSSQPQLLAVDVATLAARNAFQPNLSVDAPTRDWNALRPPHGGAAIPAVVDQTTLMWALKRKVGDVLTYTDENGNNFDVQIVGTIPDSVFQGYLLIDEQAFLEKFPSHPGYSIFLADVKVLSAERLEPLRARIESGVRDAGGRVTLTRDVLAAFHEIENTYIAIFNVLGSLGVLLGSLGLAIVVARNLRERRGEFAVMTAIGIPRAVLAKMVFAEFCRLVLWGIGIGMIASAVAIWPSVTSLPTLPTFLLVAGLVVGIMALNLVSGWAVFRWSTRDLRGNVAQAAL